MTGAPSRDGLSQAEPVVSALRASIPSAGEHEDLEDYLARLCALYGLGTVSGHDRMTPPNADWSEYEWQRRILDLIPAKAEALCYELSAAIASAIEARSDATPKSDAAEGESATRQGDAQ